MLALCPHLKAEQITELLKQAKGKDPVYFSMPPLTVLGAVVVAAITPAHFDRRQKKFVASALTFEGCQRLRCSYKDQSLIRVLYNEDQNGPWVPKLPQFGMEAIDFANTTWPERLVLDSWVDLVRFEVREYGNTRDENVEVLFAVTDRSLAEIALDTTRAPIMALDNAITIVTDDFAAKIELAGNRPVKQLHSCDGAESPIPPKVWAYMQFGGSRFSFDPMLGVQKQVKEWEIAQAEIAKAKEAAARDEFLAKANAADSRRHAAICMQSTAASDVLKAGDAIVAAERSATEKEQAERTAFQAALVLEGELNTAREIINAAVQRNRTRKANRRAKAQKHKSAPAKKSAKRG